MSETNGKTCGPVDISETDILMAMKDIQGYIDISPGDFKEVFQPARRSRSMRFRPCSSKSKSTASPLSMPAVGRSALSPGRILFTPILPIEAD
jgi:CBS domain-containing membrane protein